MIPDAPPAWDTAAVWADTIQLAVRFYCKDEIPEIWRRRRDWFYARYRWKALDDAIAYDTARWCREQ